MGTRLPRAIDERSGGQLQVEDAALYQALHRLERQSCVIAEWGASETNCRIARGDDVDAKVCLPATGGVSAAVVRGERVDLPE